MMAAGVDTTTLTIEWAFNALATGQIQINSNEEFTQDHLNIVNRLASVVPLALPHTARYGNEVCGYYVPKGSILFFNLFAVHQTQLKSISQETYHSFPDVHSRCPTRAQKNSPDAIPFSLGNLFD